MCLCVYLRYIRKTLLGFLTVQTPPFLQISITQSDFQGEAAISAFRTQDGARLKVQPLVMSSSSASRKFGIWLICIVDSVNK